MADIYHNQYGCFPFLKRAKHLCLDLFKIDKYFILVQPNFLTELGT